MHTGEAPVRALGVLPPGPCNHPPSCLVAWSAYSYHRKGGSPGHKTEYTLQLGQKEIIQANSCNSPTLYTSSYIVLKLIISLCGILAIF